MQAIQNMFSTAAPDKEPPKTVLGEWKAYQSGGGAPGAGSSSAAAPSASQSDRLLASAEEGGTSAAGGSSWWSSATGMFSNAGSLVSGATTSMPSTTQWAYFAALFGAGVLFLIMAFFLFLPVLILAPAKFAMAFSIGSGLILASLGALKGWKAMYSHLFAKERLPFTAAYLGSLVGTLYASLAMHSYIFSVVCCVAQMGALVYFVASYFPGGATGAQTVLGSLGRGGFSVGGALLRASFSRG